jgi:prepilin-type N-terminal cleavage/methylation domain-containing protein
MTRRSGFTFVELLVAMVVMSALSAIAVPRYREFKVRAYTAAMQNDLGTLRIAEEAHWAEQMHYSTDTTALDFRATSDVDIRISSQDLVAGYSATATHRMVPGLQCVTATGREAVAQESGSIKCGPVANSGGTLNPAP